MRGIEGIIRARVSFALFFGFSGFARCGTDAGPIARCWQAALDL